MTQFDKEKALKGAPVVLRNGRKAMVVHQLPTDIDQHYTFIGYELDENGKFFFSRCWLANGNFVFGKKTGLDIVGMWEESSQLVTITIPKPLFSSPEHARTYFKITSRMTIEEIVWTSDEIDKATLEYGMAFATRKDAERFLKAMRHARA